MTTPHDAEWLEHDDDTRPNELPADGETKEYNIDTQQTLIIKRGRELIVAPGWRREDRIALAFLKFGIVAGFFALEAILLLAFANVMGVR